MSYLRLFEAKALAEALNKSGYAVGVRTVQRWKAGQTPHPQDLAAIERVLQIAKEPRPEWAEALINEMGTIRSLLDHMAETQAGAMGILGELLARLPPAAVDSEGGQESAGQSDTRGR